ncbi:MAG: TonB-dependent receptor [Bryobacterales bacterium]|nr:TonB-dependent receptor [Bryobacterales bacterium]
MPDTLLTAVNQETAVSRQTRTTVAGYYVFPALPPGIYDVRAERAGFASEVRRDIRLTVAEAVTVPFVLQVGAVDQEITVTGGADRVETQSAQLSYLVEERAIEELPLNGRNYTDLALLQPGVVAFPHRDGGSVVAHGLGMSINGQDPRSNVYLLDGTPLNDFTNGPAGSAAGTVLGADTIREFRVETNAYSAEYGRNFGGQVNVLTKSGSNGYHGTAFLFHRNDALDAREFFDRDIPRFRRYQSGGSLGGPVRQDRTFFFLGVESLRDGLGRTIQTIVPDANARLGLLPDPTNPSRLIDVGVHPAVRPFLDEFPLPNGPARGGGLAGYAFLFDQDTDQDFGQGRLDHVFSPAHQVFARYTYDGGEQQLPTDFPQFPRRFLSRNQFLTLQSSQVWSPGVYNATRFGFSRTRIGQDVEVNTANPLPPFVPGRPYVGNIDIGNIPRFGTQASVDVRLVQSVFGFENNLVLHRGRHLVKLGGLLERYRDNMVNPTFSLGTYAFGDLRGFLENRPLRFVGLRPDGEIDRYWRFTLFGFYIQDDVRIHSRLHLNVGLRYEFSTMPVDLYGRDSALRNLSDPEPTLGPLYRNPTYRNIAPRFGFAWDPRGDGRSALRGGYGLFFNTNNQQNLIVTVTNPPATPRLIIPNPTFPNPPFERGIGNSIRPIEWNIRNPYVQVWNLNVQRDVGLGTVVMLGYAGSRGIHLWRSGDVNIPQPETLADGTLFFAPGLPRPNPHFTTIELKKSDGNSWYNAMIFEVRRRWDRGFEFQSSYTLSRTIDTTQASTFFSDATNGTTSAFPEFPGFSYNRGLADFHAKHNWVMHAHWEVARSRGPLLGGWQLSAIHTARSGSPLTVFVAQNRSRSLWAPSLGPGLGQDRPSMAPGYTHRHAVLGDPNRYFDPAAFALQPAGTLGNLGRGALSGPNLRTLDVALARNFHLPGPGETARLQLRAEAFNVLNRTNFGIPSLVAFSGAAAEPLDGFGVIRRTLTSARQMQVGIRIRF